MTARRFLLLWARSLGALLAAWLALFALQLGVTTHFSESLRDFIGAKRRIALAEPSPKLVALGGSNVLYGIRCDSLERLASRPAANLGLFIGLGPDYLARLAQDVLRPGDTLLLSLEYDQYVDTAFHDSMLQQQVFGNDPGYLLTLSLADQARWFFGIDGRRLAYALLSRFAGHPADLHTRIVISTANLDARGDANNSDAAHRAPQIDEYLATLHIPDHAALLPGDTRIWPVLLGLRDGCAAHGIRLRIAFPPYPLPRTPQDAARHDRFFTALDAFYDRNGFVRLGTPWETLHPRRDFLDTEYHLILPAAESHTAALAAELLASEPKTP